MMQQVSDDPKGCLEKVILLQAETREQAASRERCLALPEQPELADRQGMSARWNGYDPAILIALECCH